MAPNSATSASQKARNPKEPQIKLRASIGVLKTVSDGTINLTLSFAADQLLTVMRLVGIKQDGDQVALRATRIKIPKVKKTDAPKKQDNQKNKARRRVSRYPYRD